MLWLLWTESMKKISSPPCSWILSAKRILPSQPNQSVGDHWRSRYDQYRYAKTHAVDTIMHFIRGRYNAQFSNLSPAPCRNGRIETLQFQIKEDNKLTQYPSLNEIKKRRLDRCHYSRR